MPHLNLDLDYFDHPKTVRLVGLLGRGADLLPIRLWCYCGKYHAENGHLTGYSPEEIETAAKWWGQPGRALEALVKTGFIERFESGYKIHDWEQINGHIAALKERAQAGAKARWDKYRAEKDAQAMLKHSSSNASSNAPSFPSLPVREEESVRGADPESPPPEPDTLGETVRRLRKTASSQIQDRVLLELDLWQKDFPGLDIPHLIQKTLRGIDEMQDPPTDGVAFFLAICKTEFNHRKALGVDTAEQVIRYLNEKTSKKFKHTTDATAKSIAGRMNDGYTLADFKKVIDNKVADWLQDPAMEKYLCPDTLFRPSHFEKYLNQHNAGAKHGTDRKNPNYESQAQRNARTAREAYAGFLPTGDGAGADD